MIFLILILAFILRLININQSFWLDEATQAILSSKSIEYIWFERGGDFHPPLSYLLTHFWLMGGTNEIWLRLLPILFGVGTVFGIYKLGGKLVDKRFGLLSALLFSLAPFHIYYSQELRMYSMATFFATWSMYFLLTRHSIGYIGASLALLLTHYLGFFVIFAQLLYIVFVQKNITKWYLKNLGVTLALWGLWLPQFLIQLRSGVNIDQYLPGWRELLSLSLVKSIPLTFIKFSIGRIDFDNKIVYGLVALVVVLCIGTLMVWGIRKAREETRLLIFWLLVPIILALMISIKIPLFQPFRLLVILPAFYLLVALGIWYLGRWKNLSISLVILISLGGLLLFNLNPRYWREDWRGATNFINQKVDSNSAVVFAWPVPFPPYEWYKGREGIGAVKSFPASELEVKNNMGKLNDKENIYLFEYLQALSDPSRNIQKWLGENGYQLKDTSNFNGVGFIYHYQVPH